MAINISTFDDSILKRVFSFVKDKKDLATVSNVCSKWHAISKQFLDVMKKDYDKKRSLISNASITQQSPVILIYAFVLNKSPTNDDIPLTYYSGNNGEVLGSAVVNEGTVFYLRMQNCNTVDAKISFLVKNSQGQKLINNMLCLPSHKQLETPRITAQLNEFPITYFIGMSATVEGKGYFSKAIMQVNVIRDVVLMDTTL